MNTHASRSSVVHAGHPPTSRWLAALILSVLVASAVLVGLAGSLATRAHVDGWYADAAKPVWTPPDAVFGPVWGVLYVAMGVAAWLVWLRRREARVRPALTGYVVQLVLNAIWTPLFFALYPTLGVTALWIAFGVIVVLIFVVAYLVAVFWRVSRAAGIIMALYLAWLLFASTLNAGVAIMQG